MNKEQYTGICVSCLHAAGCVYKKNSSPDTPVTPVTQCEQFEIALDSAAVPSPTRAKEADQDNKPDTEQTVYSGLCRTCAVSGTCKHVTPGQGVLDCEEYE